MTSELILKIGANVNELRTGLERANSQIQGFQNKISQLGSVFTGLFAGTFVTAIGQAVWEMSKLASEAEGVKMAFAKIPDSARLMRELKEATAGTVSELELMKAAVQFKNFNLDLSQMPKLLEFATKRAQETGQSVDYLVESITTGLGRKSVLILDNLGLSSAKINEEIAKTGDFFGAVGKIVDEELSNMGPILDNSATQAQRLAAETENLKVKFGELINSGSGINSMMKELVGLMEDVNAVSAKPTGLSKIVDVLIYSNPIVLATIGTWKGFRATIDALGTTEAEHTEKLKQRRAELEKLQKTVGLTANQQKEYIRILIELGDTWKSSADKATSAQVEQVQTIESLKNRMKELDELKKTTSITNVKLIAQYNREIESIKAQIKALDELGIKQQKVAMKRQTSVNLSVAMPTKTLVNIESLLSNVKIVEQPIKQLEGMFINLDEVVRMSMVNLAVSFGEAIGNMISGIGGIKQISAAVLGTFGNMATQMGQLFIQFGIAGIALKKFAMKPGAAIAAGVALVALGKVLSNKASGMLNAGGGGGRESAEGFARDRLQTSAQDIKLTFEPFKIEGTTLVSVIRQTEQRNRFTRAGG